MKPWVSSFLPLLLLLLPLSSAPMRPWGTHVQHILLHHRVQDDGDEEIEEDGGTVLPAIVVESDFPFCKDNQTGHA